MYEFEKLLERFRKDTEFNALVTHIENCINIGGFSPLEVRQAVFFALMKYEYEHVKPMIIDGVEWHYVGPKQEII
jgi:hypothetical protein